MPEHLSDQQAAPLLCAGLIGYRAYRRVSGSAIGLYGFGAAVGFSIVLILFSAMRERLAVADVPVPFKGAAIAMITAGLMSLAFMGFSGLVKL